MTTTDQPPRTDIGNAIRKTLISAKATDDYSDPANVVEGLFAIARSIDGLAAAVTRVAHGGIDEPTGLEAVSMAINGGRNDDWPSIVGAIRDGYTEIAAALREGKD